MQRHNQNGVFGIFGQGLARAGIAIAMVGLGTLTACTTNKSTGRSQMNMLSTQEEISIGEQGKVEMLAEYDGEVEQADLRAYVREVGMKLVATTVQDDPRLQSLPWEFFLLDSEVINAFALPGGKVFMSLGLASKMTNEAQLAGVLGHEIGHVAAEHIDERFSRQMGAQIGIGILGTVVASTAGVNVSELAGQIGEIALMSYDRGQESESDTLGMRYMSRANYDPKGMRQVMEILKAAAGGAAQPEWMSTHPLPQTRIDDIDKRLRGEYANTQGNSQYTLAEAPFRQRFLSRIKASAAPRREDPEVRRFVLTSGREGSVPGFTGSGAAPCCHEHSRPVGLIAASAP